MKYADLHLHSIFSDSTYTPAGLIQQAKTAGLDCIALVDHDTVAGIDYVIEAAVLQKDIETLPGVEVTAEYEGQEIHILGYLIDYKDRRLASKLEFLKKTRTERIYKIIARLKDLGINLEADAVFGMVGHDGQGTVGRMHVAQAMLKQGLVVSTAEAFARYIGDKCPAQVLDFGLSPYEAISLIREAGGIAVLAHPYSLGKAELIPKLVDYGIMGLEVYYPQVLPAMVNFYLGLAKKYNLLVTGGSDCHGRAKAEVKIGSIKIPYELVEKLKAAKSG